MTRSHSEIEPVLNNYKNLNERQDGTKERGRNGEK